MLLEGWKKQENSFTTFPFMGGTPGPVTPSNGESCRECFERFFTSAVWVLLVTETNRFAAQGRTLPHLVLGRGMMWTYER